MYAVFAIGLLAGKSLCRIVLVQILYVKAVLWLISLLRIGINALNVREI
jgi:hypothetical protein